MRKLAAVIALIGLAGCGGPRPAKQTSENAAPAKAAAPRITHFYASPSEVERGGSVTICYGVENADSVRLEPPAEAIQPGYNRCIHVTPQATTTYRFVAEGPGGQAAATAEVVVKGAKRPPAKERLVLITMFLADKEAVQAGAPVTLCYGAPEAASVSIDPPVAPLEPSRRKCFTVRPTATTTYTLTARGPTGNVDSEKVTVTVR